MVHRRIVPKPVPLISFHLLRTQIFLFLLQHYYRGKCLVFCSRLLFKSSPVKTPQLRALMPQTTSSPLGRSSTSPTEGNISWSSSWLDHHDFICDATSALFSDRFENYREEEGGRRASDTFPRLRDMASSPLRIWHHSSESLPPSSLPITLRRDMEIKPGIFFLQIHPMSRINLWERL